MLCGDSPECSSASDGAICKRRLSGGDQTIDGRRLSGEETSKHSGVECDSPELSDDDGESSSAHSAFSVLSSGPESAHGALQLLQARRRPRKPVAEAKAKSLDAWVKGSCRGRQERFKLKRKMKIAGTRHEKAKAELQENIERGGDILEFA